jgi:hypothetical protein
MILARRPHPSERRYRQPPQRHRHVRSPTETQSSDFAVPDIAQRGRSHARFSACLRRTRIGLGFAA